MTTFRTLCFARESTTSFKITACVEGFMLMVMFRSSCPVFTPKGMAGSTMTLAPASAARRADSEATYSDSIISVPKGRWKLCGSVAPQGSIATSYLTSWTAFHGADAKSWGKEDMDASCRWRENKKNQKSEVKI